MPKYYNTTRAALPLTLRNGKAIVAPGKSWITIEKREDGSETIMDAIRSGDLVPSKHVENVAPPESHVALEAAAKAKAEAAVKVAAEKAAAALVPALPHPVQDEHMEEVPASGSDAAIPHAAEVK